MASAIPVSCIVGRLKKLNAARTSAAGDSLRSPNLNFHFPLEMKMQTILATWTKNRLIWSKISRFLFILKP